MYQFKLDDYFFPEISVKANPKYNPESSPAASAAQISIKSAFGYGEENNRDSVRVVLTVQVDKDGEEDPPYDIKIVGVGDFSLRFVENENDKTSEENKKELRKKTENRIHYNGMSILYGATRDIIMSLTSRGPWEPVLLPLHHFSNETNKAENNAVDALSGPE